MSSALTLGYAGALYHVTLPAGERSSAANVGLEPSTSLN